MSEEILRRARELFEDMSVLAHDDKCVELIAQALTAAYQRGREDVAKMFDRYAADCEERDALEFAQMNREHAAAIRSAP